MEKEKDMERERENYFTDALHIFGNISLCERKYK